MVPEVLVVPAVSKTFCRILDGAPAWARAWAALTARRSTHLEFAKCKPWNYRESRPYTKAELRAAPARSVRRRGDVMAAVERVVLSAAAALSGVPYWLGNSAILLGRHVGLPLWLRSGCSLGALLLGPFYAVSVYAFWTKQQEAR